MIPITLLIPAYNPQPTLLDLVNQAINQKIKHIVVINDGSSTPQSLSLFDTLRKDSRIVVLDHTYNMGKGAALKTGFKYISLYLDDCAGIVTADADGQHVIDDIVKVGQALLNEPNNLILGVRTFDNGVPFRSKIGNVVTRWVFNKITGVTITDTQTGLRGIGLVNIPIYLKIPSNRYEFELEMLLISNSKGIKITEVSTKTIYLNNNKSSHFSPFFDSMRIYSVFLKFMLDRFWYSIKS